MSLNLRIVSPEKVEFVGTVDRVASLKYSPAMLLSSQHSTADALLFLTLKASMR